MKMKLFVDDVREVPDDSWTLVRTIGEAIRAIRSYNFDVISLDHDIGHFPVLTFIRAQDGTKALYQDKRNNDHVACSENYKAVAYFIVEHYGWRKALGDLKRPKIVIHTMNVPAAEELKKILEDFEVERNLAYTPM